MASDQSNVGSGAKGGFQNKGQQKTYDITGTAPDGTPLPPRTVTQQQWREEKLGKQGYVKPEDLDETEGDTGGTTTGGTTDSGSTGGL